MNNLPDLHAIITGLATIDSVLKMHFMYLELVTITV